MLEPAGARQSQDPWWEFPQRNHQGGLYQAPDENQEQSGDGAAPWLKPSRAVVSWHHPAVRERIASTHECFHR